MNRIIVTALLAVVAAAAISQVTVYEGWQQAPQGHVWMCNVCGWRNIKVWTRWENGVVVRREHEDMRPPRTGAKHYDIVPFKTGK